MLFGSNAQQLRGRPAVHINGRMNLDAVYGAAIPLGDTFQHAGFVKLIAINMNSRFSCFRAWTRGFWLGVAWASWELK